MKVVQKAIKKLHPYENNPRKNDQAVEAVAASIQEFGFKVPIVIDKSGTIITGHTRYKAAMQLGLESVPCIVADDLTEEQIRAFRIADNSVGALATWDFDILEAELEEIQDIDMGLFTVDMEEFKDDQEDWFEKRKRYDNENDDQESEEYQEFLGKFENKKTTDDCYTPDNIYDAVAEYVEKLTGVKREKFIRPFYPGGDYQKEKYPEDKIVVDNPPFSILAEIVDWYVEHGIRFFVFAPGTSVLGYCTREKVTAVCTYVPVTYENGAIVQTNFITNLFGEDLVAISTPELRRKLREINKENERRMHRSLPKYEYPNELITTAKLGWLSQYGQELKISRKDACFVRTLDAMKEMDKGIFGGGLLLSEKAAAEKAAADKWQLSDREKQIVAGLGR